MFGYVVINQAEMKFREYDVYHGYYCGLCQSLKEKYGARGQMTLTYDMTFVAMLLTGLYEPVTKDYMVRCVAHPVHKHRVFTNEFTEYAADMNILLSYEKNCDDWADERKLTKRAFAKLLKKADRQVAEKYPEKTEKILQCLTKIYACEKKNELDIDKMSGYYGEVMSEILAYQQDVWEGILRKMGFYLGKFIYLMDAFEDVEEDIKKDLYNPLKKRFRQSPDTFNDQCKEILMMMMAECSKEFEKLPILENVEILRNILYSGVWYRYQQVVNERNKQQEKIDGESI